MTLDTCAEHLKREPRLRDYLTHIVRHVHKQQRLPAEISLGAVPEDQALYDHLVRFLGPTQCRVRNNRLKLRLHADQRDPAAWQALVSVLQLPSEQPKVDMAHAKAYRVFSRLILLFPEYAQLIQQMRQMETFQKVARTREDASVLLSALLQGLALITTSATGITLSELGSKLLNDSKALRSGLRRTLLIHLLRLRCADHDAAETLSDRDVLTLFNIIDNPYTTHVVLFAPFAYETQSGEWFDWPHQLFLRGQAALLAWETVRTLRSIRWITPCPRLVSSENAAPFHRLIEAGIPAIYTEGYPNTAVTTVLRFISQTQTTLAHWGDTDLDGFRIQDRLAAILPTESYSRQRDSRAMIPLDPARCMRLQRFLLAHPDFRYSAELRYTLQHGWCEQESEL